MSEGRVWTLLGINEPGKPGRIVIWDTAEITVGRAPESDIMVDDSDASRQHAEFRRTGEGYAIVDLGTSNGTFVNDERVAPTRVLENKDVIKICEMTLRFIETRKDPAALGLEVAYASDLKTFSGGASPTADPGTTTLGLVDPVAGPFVVGAVNDYQPTEAQAPRDLDLDLDVGEFGPGAPGIPKSEPGTLSLHLELEGLTPDLRRTLEGLFGKVIELPALRVRIKDDDGL